MDDNFNLGKALVLRFVRGAISGAVSSMVALQLAGVHSFNDLASFYTSLGLAGIVGATTGGLLAIDKFIRADK